MSDAVEQPPPAAAPPPKKRRTREMTPEEKDALKVRLAAGRERARAEREAIRQEQAARALNVADPPAAAREAVDDFDQPPDDDDDLDGTPVWEADHGGDDDEEDPEPEPSLPPPVLRPAALRTVDDVAKKHAAQHAGDFPTPAQVAQRTVVSFGAGNAIPPVESDPHKRDAPTTGPIETVNPDLFTEAPPELHNLEDLFGAFSIGDGHHVVNVFRRAPKQYGTVPCEGVQRPITRYLTASDFSQEYGGGDYILTVYGPPKRGGVWDPALGGYRPKALTKPIRHTVPLSAYPPNLLAAALDDMSGPQYDENEDPMRAYGPAFSSGNGRAAAIAAGRPPTSADARIHEANLTHTERIMDRAEQKEREMREQYGKLPQEVQQQMAPMFQMMVDQNRNTIDAMRKDQDRALNLAQEQARQLEAERQRERDRADALAEQQRVERDRLEREKERNKGSEVDNALKLATALRPSEEVNQAELRRMSESYRVDVERMQRAHQDEVKRVEERVGEIERRSDQRVKDAEARAESRTREVELRAEKAITDAKDEARRQVTEVERLMQARLDDERRNADRDKQMLESTWQVRQEGQKAMYENRISTLGDTVTQVRTESERHRAEAEKRKDIGKQVLEFKTTAAALGMIDQSEAGAQPDEGPKSWKDVAMIAASQLPAMFDRAAQTVRDMRGAAAAPPPGAEAYYAQQQNPMMQQPNMLPQQRMPGVLHGRGGMPIGAPPLAWGTQGGIGFSGTDDSPEAQWPDSLIREPPTMMEAIAPAIGGQPLAATPRHMAPLAPPVMATQQQPQQAPMQPQQVPQQAVGVPGISLGPEQIASIRETLERAVNEGASAVDEARDFVAALGVPGAAQIAANVTPERIVAIVQSQPGGNQSPLLRRDGQKFLRELWVEIKRLTAGVGAA